MIYRIAPVLRRSFLAVSSIVIAGGLSLPATADVSHTVFEIVATSAMGTGSYSITVDQTSQSGSGSDSHWSWANEQDIRITDPNTGNLIATLDRADLTIDQDPQVNLGFTLVAGPSTTTFLVKSALVSFPTMLNPLAKTSASLTATDSFGGNGATMSKLSGALGQYRSEYNGLVPGGTAFSELIPTVLAPAFGSKTEFANDGYRTIFGNVSDMSAQVNFTLSARDTASGTTDYRIIPEPTTLGLLGLGALVLARRNR